MVEITIFVFFLEIVFCLMELKQVTLVKGLARTKYPCGS